MVDSVLYCRIWNMSIMDSMAVWRVLDLILLMDDMVVIYVLVIL